MPLPILLNGMRQTLQSARFTRPLLEILRIVGEISDLSPAAIKIAGSGSAMLLYFRATSSFDYKDARQVPTEANKDRVNKYPTVIDIKFGNGDRVVIAEYFSG